MFGKTDMMTGEARFGTSAAFAGLEALADAQRQTAKRERLMTAVLASVAFVAAFAAALIMGA